MATFSLVGALVLAACTTTDPGEGPTPADAVDDVASALDDMGDPSIPDPLIDPDHVRSGGPPPDGIPPMDDPEFEPVPEVQWLDGDEPVLSLTVGGETRAYPLQVMTWHEIVNDSR